MAATEQGTITPGNEPILKPNGTSISDEWGVRQTDLRKEYATGGLYNWATLKHALPWWIDDITSDFGDDIYERMLKDPQVSSCNTILKLATIAQGLDILPAIDPNAGNSGAVGGSASGKSVNPEAGQGEKGQAQEIAEFCARNIQRLSQPFLSHTLFDLMDGFAFGNKIAEQVYELCQVGIDQGKMCLKALKPKPRHSVAFVVDPYMNIVGIMVAFPGQASITQMSSIAGPPSTVVSLLPREKFAVLTFRPQNNDPRGTSILRPSYNPWWLKTQIWPEYLKYLVQFAGPSVVGKPPPGAVKVPLVDQQGNPVVDGSGIQIYVTPETALLQALENWRNGTVLVVPAGTEIDVPYTMEEGEAFLKAIDLFDRQITKGILNQTLATEEGRFQARAAAQTHQDVLDLVIYHCKLCIVDMIEKDILWPLVYYNYGEEAAYAFCPKASLAETERHDFAQNATAIARLVQVGYVHGSQLPGLDALLSLPPRAEPEEFGPNLPIGGLPGGAGMLDPNEQGPQNKPDNQGKGNPSDKNRPNTDMPFDDDLLGANWSPARKAAFELLRGRMLDQILGEMDSTRAESTPSGILAEARAARAKRYEGCGKPIHIG